MTRPRLPDGRARPIFGRAGTTSSPLFHFVPVQSEDMR